MKIYKTIKATWQQTGMLNQKQWIFSENEMETFIKPYLDAIEILGNKIDIETLFLQDTTKQNHLHIKDRTLSLKEIKKLLKIHKTNKELGVFK